MGFLGFAHVVVVEVLPIALARHVLEAPCPGGNLNIHGTVRSIYWQPTLENDHSICGFLLSGQLTDEIQAEVDRHLK